MSFCIQYFSVENKHITLRSDGQIEMYVQGMNLPILIDYKQSQMLKKMIIVEAKLEKVDK